MENETVSKNFIEQMIDKDIEEGYCHEVHTTGWHRSTAESSIFDLMIQTRPRRKQNL